MPRRPSHAPALPRPPPCSQALLAQNAELRHKLQQRDAALARTDELLAELTSLRAQAGTGSDEGAAGSRGDTASSAGSRAGRDVDGLLETGDAQLLPPEAEQQEQGQEQGQRGQPGGETIAGDAVPGASGTSGTSMANLTCSEVLITLEGELQVRHFEGWNPSWSLWGIANLNSLLLSSDTLAL